MFSIPASRCHTLLILFIFVLVSVRASHAHNRRHHHLHHPRHVLEASPDNGRNLNDFASGLLARDTASTNSSGQDAGSSASSSGDYTCGPNKPCGNGACCGESGWCGYSPTYCGPGCQSNCNAKAECGRYAANPGKTCPLNVCCSEYGFCGTTSDFCGDGCQSNCNQPKPQTAGSDVQRKIIAYYEGWNTQHDCGTMAPEEIPIEMLTHLNFAFGYISSDFKVTNMDGLDASLYRTITNLKKRNPSLKVLIALGGWTFSDPGPWQGVFPTMVSTESNRQRFITNLLGFMSQYGFDGVDFDWEYPGADDRGGGPDDGTNYTRFLKELKAAISLSHSQYIVTFTAPTSYWYLRHFDIGNMVKYVDWINMMSYDLHGVWDRDNPIGNQVLAHTNLTEVDLALDLFWRVNIDPSKIVMGLGFYGRSFQLTDASCWKPGCAFSGPGRQGPCTKTGGILSYKEIADIIASTNAKPYVDKTAAVNYLVYGDNNWISYDDAYTFKMKIDFANKRGLNGLMVWAVDLDDTYHTALKAISPIAELEFEEDEGPAIKHDTTSASSCFTQVECGTPCPVGYNAMTRVGRLDGHKTCPKNNFRYVCCPSWSAPSLDQCHWAENRTKGVPTDCAGTCNPGQIKIAGDSWGWQGSVCSKGDHDGCDGHAGHYCARGGVSFCCDAGNAQQYLNICRWSDCKETCSDMPGLPYELTTDSGGPSNRCPAYHHGLGDSPNTPYFYTRSLCCKSKTSLNNCDWHSKKQCSESCPSGQIEIDSDPNGPGGHLGNCYGSRRAVFCCDPPAGLDKPFLPVDLENLFPAPYLPAPSSIPKFDLVSFGGLAGGGEAAPNADGVAFFLIAGDSYAVSRLKKRSGEAEPFTFISCPQNPLNAPDDQPQVARVVCLNPDTEGCFQVTERGVEGTIVEMPDNCARGSWARAISLEPSRDQSLPLFIRTRSINSVVYDFKFDYNIGLRRRDAGPTSIRMDYSNVGGYWDAVVDSPGIQNERRSLEERFFSAKSSDWSSKFAALNFPKGYAKVVKQDLGSLIYFQTRDQCPASGGRTLPDAVGAGIQGNANVNAFYGFSMIANIVAERMIVREAAGFFHAEGQTDITFDVGGVGTLDASKINSGNPASKTILRQSLGGHSIFKGWATFDPYIKTSVSLGTRGSSSDTAVSLDGKASMRLVSDFGKMTLMYPDIAEPQSGDDDRPKDRISVPSSNVLYGGKRSGTIGITSQVDLGIKVNLQLPSRIGTGDGDLPDMSISKLDYGVFNITAGTGEDSGRPCLDYYTVTYLDQKVEKGPSVGWQASGSEVSSQANTPEIGKCYQTDTGGLDKRTSNPTLQSRQSGGWAGFPGLRNGRDIRIDDILPLAYGAFVAPQLQQSLSLTCLENEEDDPCCGCIDMNEAYHYTDIECPNCDGDDTTDGQNWPFPSRTEAKRSLFGNDSDALPVDEEDGIFEHGDDIDLDALHPLFKRVAGKAYQGPKMVTFGEPPKLAGPKYPSFPQAPNWPWDGIESGKWDAIDRYYGNASADCEDWSVAQTAKADVERTSAGTVRAKYQTEHLFEGQMIGDFFNWWILEGHTPNQIRENGTNQPAVNNMQIRDQNWINTWIKRVGPPWTNAKGRQTSFGRRLLEEMGSSTNLDRLAIYQARPNGKKGALWSGNHGTAYSSYRTMGQDAQLCATKEWGMMYEFLRIPNIFRGFCATYEGVYDLMGRFDQNYNAQAINAGDTSQLQAQWKEFTRVTIDSMVERSRADLQHYYQNRIVLPPDHPAHAYWEFKWYHNLVNNMRKIAMTQTCNNMDPSRARPAFSGDPDEQPSPTASPSP